jgi:translation initiation factor 2D
VQSTRNGETTEFVKKGSLKPIVIKAEDRGRRKYITRISGMETFCILPEELAAILKKEFSASVSIDDLPGKHDHGKELSIQGHVVIQLADLLRKNMGVPAKFIDAQN